MLSLAGHKMMWVWHPEGEFRSPTSVAMMAYDGGITALAYKHDDNGYPFSDAQTDFGFRLEGIRGYLETMQVAGIQAGLWGYHYGERLTEEADMACRAIDFKPDFYIVDWEAEFQRNIAKSGTINPFGQYLQRIREYRDKVSPTTGLFHAPLAQPRFWYPWMYKAFQEAFDGMMPQIYHRAMGYQYDEALAIAYEDYAHYGLTTKPIFPAGQAYDVPPQEVLAWGVQAVRVYGATGLSWWKLEDAYGNGCLQAIRDVPLREDSMRRVSGTARSEQGKVLPVGTTTFEARKLFSLLASDTRVVLDLEVAGVLSKPWPVVIVRDGGGAFAGYLDGTKTRDRIPVYMMANPSGNITLEVQRGPARVVLFGILEAG